jgi:hypothetical protein
MKVENSQEAGLHPYDWMERLGGSGVVVPYSVD